MRSQNLIGLTYDVRKIALPRSGLSGAEKKEETKAWTTSMAESERLVNDCRFNKST